MRKFIRKTVVVLLFIVLSAGISRCYAQGFVEYLGIRDSKDVKLVIRQYGIVRDSLFASVSRVYVVSDPVVIQAFYDALNHPKWPDGWEKCPSTSRLAFITNDGGVAMLPIGGGTPPYPSVLADLSPAYSMAEKHGDAWKTDTTTVPYGEISEIEYHAKKGDIVKRLGSSLIDKHIQDLCGQLMSFYNPLTLTGNIEYPPQEFKKVLDKSPRYIKVRLQKPAKFNAVVVTTQLENYWPPKYGDTSARYKEVSCDTIYMVVSGSFFKQDIVQFGFASSKSDVTMLTLSTDPRPWIPGNGKTPSRFGDDLFDKLCKACMKQ